MSDLRIAALIMAAGASSRFGGCKHLAEIGGVPILQTAVNHVRGLVAETYAVTGAWHSEISTALSEGRVAGVTLIHNTRWQRGLGCSIAAGVAKLATKYDGILILLADQVAITPEDIQALLASFDGDNITCGLYAARRGVPAIFAARYFEQLMALDGDKGARSVLLCSETPVTERPMPLAAVDIDTAPALAEWVSKTQG